MEKPFVTCKKNLMCLDPSQRFLLSLTMPASASLNRGAGVRGEKETAVSLPHSQGSVSWLHRGVVGKRKNVQAETGAVESQFLWPFSP